MYFIFCSTGVIIGDYHLPASRRTSRLFGDVGRTKGQRSGVKIEKIDADYDPTTDTCVRAFVRLMAQQAQERLQLRQPRHLRS